MTNKEQLHELTGEVFQLQSLIDYQTGSVVSRTIVDKEEVSITAFAFDETQRLSEHTSPHDAILQVVDGTANITIASEEHEVEEGETIVLPANEPHAVDAVSQFKMVLTMIG